MDAHEYYRLDSISLVDVTGDDAEAIVHNLTTNQIKNLSSGSGRESFITDARGLTLAHVLVYREDGALRLIGAGGHSQRIADHIDRYTIREDATPQIRDAEFVAFVLPAASAGIAMEASQPEEEDGLVRHEVMIDDLSATAYASPWLGPGSQILLVEADDADRLSQSLANQSLLERDESAFHVRRTQHGFPWFGIDIDEKNLPQEIARDAQTISLTKGCYLGQETVARLDALGKVQKQLVRWSIVGGVPEPGTTLTADEKKVGRLTSVTAGGDDDAIAIGFARRSHFDAGAVAQGTDSSGAPFTGRVL